MGTEQPPLQDAGDTWARRSWGSWEVGRCLGLTCRCGRVPSGCSGGDAQPHRRDGLGQGAAWMGVRVDWRCEGRGIQVAGTGPGTWSSGRQGRQLRFRHGMWSGQGHQQREIEVSRAACRRPFPAPPLGFAPEAGGRLLPGCTRLLLLEGGGSRVSLESSELPHPSSGLSPHS